MPLARAHRILGRLTSLPLQQGLIKYIHSHTDGIRIVPEHQMIMSSPKAKTAPHPGDLLRPHATDHVCVLHVEPIADLRLPVQFLTDLGNVLPKLTRQSIVEDVLHRAVSREYASRRLHNSQRRYRYTGSPVPTNRAYAFDIHTSFTVLAVLLLRPPGMIKEAAGYGSTRFIPRSITRAMSQAEREAVLRLIYSYGVGCAAGICCELCPDPIRLLDAVSI